MTPELLLLLQVALPALASFVVGHYHWILPNPLKNGGSPAPAFPVTIGHGEVIAWLLSQLVRQQQPLPTPVIPPATPAPSAAAAILAELLTILKQALQTQPQSQPQPVPKPA